MADSAISGLTAVTTPAGTDAYEVSQGGVSKKGTLSQISAYVDPMVNVASLAQGPTFATDTYVTASKILLPQARMQAGVVYRLTMSITKSAAGVVAPIFNIRTGTAVSIADASRGSFTSPVAQTAVVDTAVVEILCTFKAVGASAVLQTHYEMRHNLAATGFATQQIVMGTSISSTFDSTPVNTTIGFSMNAGTSAAWTCVQIAAELFNIAA